MSGEWIPIAAIVFGCGLAGVLVVAAGLHKVQDARMRIEAEIQKMDMAYQRARQSFSR